MSGILQIFVALELLGNQFCKIEVIVERGRNGEHILLISFCLKKKKNWWTHVFKYIPLELWVS